MIEVSKRYELTVELSLKSWSNHSEFYQEDYEIIIPLYVECACGKEDTEDDNEAWMEINLYEGRENVESLGIWKEAMGGIECSVVCDVSEANEENS